MKRPAALIVLALTLLLGLAVAPAAASDGVRIDLLSSPRPDQVSDGNALLRVSGAGLDRVKVRVDGRDVTSAFTVDPGGGSMTGLVDGLKPGRATVTAATARLVLTNHPRTGPMLAGPHEKPFVCGTAGFTTLAGAKLGAPTDANCSAPTRVDYLYRSTVDRKLKVLPATTPPDLATTTTTTGRTVPYIVRVETGVINRSIYEYAVLHDPEAGEPTPRTGPTGWNGGLVYTFGGGCPGGWYQQGGNTGGINDDVMLGRGYAVASSSLNVFGINCNGVLAAETMAMTREHVIETIGVPRQTIGWGCSGGSYQVFQIADNYPGLLDGILAACVFPEVGFATLHTITDALLLDHYFGTATGWTDEQKRAASGFGKVGTIANLAGAGKRIDPRVYCPAQLPAELRYDPVKNPDGARCDVYDHQANVWGTADGAARRPLDNVGIQYGLAALNAGTISVDQFLDLNAKVGGFDQDANFVPGRTVADARAVDTAYRTGQLTNGGGGLASTPIVDYRQYTDELANGDIHLRFHSFSLRERLRKANGDVGNHVMLVQSNSGPGFSTANPVMADALASLDRWLESTDADDRPGSAHAKVVRNKPAELVDACWTPAGEKIAEPQIDGVRTTRCNTLYPVWPSPRQVAGGKVVNDIVKCKVRPASPTDYRVPFTAEQSQRLRQVFRGGVCDWDARGVGQRGLGPAWPTF
ncbi:hypothetical protein FB561_4755 [Kribbella amoyensis]|uniref:DUF6351 domain-containing protein n=1 Tax=Kribbella amoyensis TaxID=996641 RepID=A0A561BXH8_9ACTN|nr:DUF6351 family protein [Kribbella amoyensis]TWD83589.1 hypothetical protein FB561_4755 [Kribbella amoyensis]